MTDKTIRIPISDYRCKILGNRNTVFGYIHESLDSKAEYMISGYTWRAGNDWMEFTLKKVTRAETPKTTAVRGCIKYLQNIGIAPQDQSEKTEESRPCTAEEYADACENILPSLHTKENRMVRIEAFDAGIESTELKHREIETFDEFIEKDSVIKPDTPNYIGHEYTWNRALKSRGHI